MANEFPDIPHNLRKVYRRFERWRSAHTGRLPIPERLWAAAAELAREHGVFITAKALRLEYGKLKQRVEGCLPKHGRIPRIWVAVLWSPENSQLSSFRPF